MTLFQPTKQMQVVTVFNDTRSGVLAHHVQVADTGMRRMRGLLGKKCLSAGEGLWIKPSSGVHTVGMGYAIDVIGLDKNLRVVKLWHSVVPFRVTSISLRVRSVLEFPSGWNRVAGVCLGDVLRIGTILVEPG